MDKKKRPRTLLGYKDENVFVLLTSVGRQILKNSGARLSKNSSKIFFVLSFSLFFISKLGLTALPVISRVEPVEPDDAYRYMAQAVVMEDCFSGKCLALESLSEQIRGAVDSDKTAFQRLRVDMHLFNYFHPTYSLLFNALRNMEFDLVGIYNFIYLASAVAMLIIVALWLLTIWGLMPAAIALLLLTFYVFSEHGLHAFVPSNMSLALGMVNWILILRNSKAVYWSSPLLWIAAIFMHPMGIFYVLISISLLFLRAKWPPKNRLLRLLFFAFVILTIRFTLHFFVPEFSPSLNIDAYYSDPPSLATQIVSGITTLLVLPKNWANHYWSYLAVGLFVFGGIYMLPKNKAFNILATGIGLILFFVFSAIYFHPQHGNTATQRMWTPLAIFLTGAIGNFLFVWGKAIKDWLKRLYSRPALLYEKRRSLTSISSWVTLLLVLTGLVIAQSLANYAEIGYRNFFLTLESSTAGANFRLDASNIESLLSHMAEKDEVMFIQETPLYYSLANGLLEHKIVYYPLIAGTEKESKWLTDNTNLNYLVALNPLSGLAAFSQGAFHLSGEEPISLSNELAMDISNARVRIHNPGNATMLRVQYFAEGTLIEDQLEVESKRSAWLALPAINELVNKVSFYLPGETGELIIQGFSLRSAQQTNWPWDDGVSVSHQDTIINLSSEFLYTFFALKFEVISDDGSIIIVKFYR